MLVTYNDLAQMAVDMHNAMFGLGSSEIIIEYKSVANSDDSYVDPVYKNTVIRLQDNPITALTRGLIQVIREADLAILQFGILKVGDAIFYLDPALDMNSPDPHFPVHEGTLVLIDPMQIRWKPVANRTQELTRLCAVVVADASICQAIPCYLERDERNARPVS